MATAAFGIAKADITVDRIYKEHSDGNLAFAEATRYRVRIRGLHGDEFTFLSIVENGRTGINGGVSFNPFSMAVDARNAVAAGKSLDTVVKADWLEEHGFPEAAAKLRTFDDGF